MKKKSKKQPAPKLPVKEKQPPAPEKKVSWNLIAWLALVLLAGFFLHTKAFSDFNSIFAIPERGAFNRELNFKAMLMGFLIVLCFVLLYLIEKLVRKKIANIFLMTVTWLLILFYAGGIWVSVYPPSQGDGTSLIANIWFKKYWDRNHFGFRDREFNFKDIENQKIILDLGDSFVAGHGIRDTANRTSNLLQKKLGGYFLVNAGINGAGTLLSLKNLMAFPLTPKFVILCHVVNDIEDVIPKEDKYDSIYLNTETPFTSFLYKHSRNSAFMDMVYHFFKTQNYSNIKSATVITQPYQWYKIDTVFNKHMQDIQQFADYVTDTMRAKLILVTYPDYGNRVLDSSDMYVNKKIIKNLRPDSNIYFLNATSIYKQLSQFQRRVNFLDGHPSEKVNRMVADSLYEIIASVKE